MSVNEKQTFINALNGGMVGKFFPTQLDDDVMSPLKDVLKKDLDTIFKKTAATQVPPTSAPSASASSASAHSHAAF